MCEYDIVYTNKGDIMEKNNWWHKNWYRRGYSHALFNYIRRKKVVTKAECREWLIKEFGLGDKASSATVTTVLSPRFSSRRGDCRGNRSSCGEYYYMEKWGRKVRYGVKEPQQFCLRWRERPLEARGRDSMVEIKQDKTPLIKKIRTKKLKDIQDKIKILEKEMVELS